MDLRPVHIRLEGSTSRIDDPRARPFIRLLKRDADRTEPGQGRNQILLGHRAFDVERPNVDLRPPAPLPDAAHALRSPKANCPGSSGLRTGRFGSNGQVRERPLDIAEVAQRSGVPASALRHYEEKGLIVSVGRRGLRRLFDPGIIERLASIALGRTVGAFETQKRKTPQPTRNRNRD